ncbi:MAG: hypothetical protein IKN04_19710 [Clostridia bacterium]|nr:hypothetical protein [Clostridia bacterium]
MKKLLTIVALMLVLCLSVSAALAYTWEDLDDDQKANIQEQVEDWLGEDELFDSARVTFTDPGRYEYTDEDGYELHGGFGPCDEHADWEYEYFYKNGNSKIYIDEDEINEFACKYDIWGQRYCPVCGYQKEAQIVLNKLDHQFFNVGWTTKDPSKLDQDDELEADDIVLEADATAEEISDYICSGELAKGKKLYLAARCAVCGTWKTVKTLTSNGGHLWASTGKSNETIDDVLVWAKVVENPTCMDKGWAVDYCTICGVYGDGYAIPTVAHSYTKKHYDFNDLPNCKNGMTATYALECEYGCGNFEGGITNFAKAKKYTETMTPDEAIKAGLVHDDWAKFYYEEDWLWADGWSYREEAYDADGHFYVVLSDASWKAYPCVANQSVKLSCVWCSKTKIVSTSGKEDKPIYTNIVSEKYIDCYTLQVEYQCAGCLGEVHANKKETIKLTDADERAHKPYWVIDGDKYVAPTCTKDGSTTYYCSLHPTVTKTVKEPATGHAWGPYTVKEKGENRTVYEATCLVCKEKQYVTIWNWEDPDDTDAQYYWVAGKEVKGTCVAVGYIPYTLYDADGKTDITKKVYTTYGDHIMEVVKEAHTAPTCTEPGIDLTICVTCTNYKPMTEAEKADKKKDDKDWVWTIVDDLTGGKVFEVVTTPATGHKVETWTENAEGKLEGTCTVCKQKVTKDKELGAAAYKLSDVKFTGNILSGKLEHVAGTKEADKISIRVTFFTAGNNYMTTTATIYADGTFEAEGAGDIEAITLVAYATDKVVNPADVATLTKLDAKEIIVK